MKKQFSFITGLFVLLTMLVQLSSCEKDEGKLPNISFKTGGSYVSGDKTVTPGEVVLVGISASKSEDKDVLKSFNIQHTKNSALTAYNDSTIDISGSPDSYAHDFSFAVAGATSDTTHYTFTVTNRDGLTNSVKLNFIVN